MNSGFKREQKSWLDHTIIDLIPCMHMQNGFQGNVIEKDFSIRLTMLIDLISFDMR